MTTSKKPSVFSRLAANLQLGGGGTAEPHDDAENVRRIIWPVLVLLFVGVCAALRVGCKAGAVGPVMLWAFSSFAAGGTAGFLFGIPKSGMGSKAPATTPAGATTETAPEPATPAPSQQARPNTNLEEVSDWVTKIIVGLTLVNIRELRREVGRISLNAAAAIRAKPDASDISVATALVVGFALIGFLAVYLYMRLFVQGAIVDSDNGLNKYRTALEHAERVTQAEPVIVPATGADPAAAAPVVPSAASLSAAQAVADAAPPNSPDLVLRPLRQLGADYETLRTTQEYSRERTRLMTEIANKMRPHAIAAAPYIDALINSPSTGDHLAATVILQMNYMPDRMNWLARRLIEERAFIAFQAASALLQRLKVAGIAECKAIQGAVARAHAERAAALPPEPSLDKLVEQILSTQ